MRRILSWEQRLDRPPEDINHFGLERAHDVGYLHRVVVSWAALGIKTGPHRRPVDGLVFSAYPRES